MTTQALSPTTSSNFQREAEVHPWFLFQSRISLLSVSIELPLIFWHIFLYMELYNM